MSPQGEWLLLFNSILPFPDLLSQAAALDCTALGLHITARTETVRQEDQDRHCTLYSRLGYKSRDPQ